MTLSSIPSFPCGPIPRITEGLRFGGDPCHLTHAGLRRPTHVCESVRRFPSPCLKFGALCRVPLYAGYVGMVSARLEQRAASPYSEVIWPSYRVLFGPSSAWFNWFAITARHAWLHCVTHGELSLVDHLRQAREVPPSRPCSRLSTRLPWGWLTLTIEGRELHPHLKQFRRLHVRLIPVSVCILTFLGNLSHFQSGISPKAAKNPGYLSQHVFSATIGVASSCPTVQRQVKS